MKSDGVEFMIKTYRDVKSGLELSRKNKIASRTSEIESSVRKEIEGKYGDFLSRFSEDVAQKEKMRKYRQSLFLEKSRLKLLMTKEKLSRLQQVRSTSPDPKNPPAKHDDSKEVSHADDETPKFRRVEFKY